MPWRSIHIGDEGEPRLEIDGIRVWQHEWRWQDSKTIALPNPLEPKQTLGHMICEAGPVRRPARFAAAKLPSGLWSFYVRV